MRTWLAVNFCVIVSFVLGTHSPARAAEPGDPLIGSWTVEYEGLKEVWTIKRDGTTWTAKCVYTEGDKVIGACHGANIKLTGDDLTFTQVYDKKPRPAWKDGAV